LNLSITNMIRNTITISIILILLLFIKSRFDVITQLKNSGGTLKEVEKKLSEEEKTNALLKEQLKFITTNDFIEQEAREKLNLTKKGEALVISTKLPSSENDKVHVEAEKVIWKKWVEKFF